MLGKAKQYRTKSSDVSAKALTQALEVARTKHDIQPQKLPRWIVVDIVWLEADRVLRVSTDMTRSLTAMVTYQVKDMNGDGSDGAVEDFHFAHVPKLFIRFLSTTEKLSSTEVLCQLTNDSSHGLDN